MLISSQRHTKITSIYRATIDKKGQNPPENIFNNKDIRKELQQDGLEGQKDSIVKNHASRLVTPKWVTPQMKE